MVYSRDGAAAVLMCLDKLISEIRAGTFLPDVTRSGRILSSPAAASPEVQNVKIEEAVHVVTVDDADSVVTDSSSSSDSVCNSDVEDTSNLTRMFNPPVAPEGFVMWQHSKLKTLHLMERNNNRVFECGRSVGSFHTKENIAPRYDTPICHRCFQKASQS